MFDSPLSVSDADVDVKEQLCNYCNTDPLVATHECLACKAVCCWECGKSHIGNVRFHHHKLVSLNSKQVCPKHNQELILFCMDDLRACCIACAQYSVEHSGHKILDFESAIEALTPQLNETKTQLTDLKENLSNKIKLYEGQ